MQSPGSSTHAPSPGSTPGGVHAPSGARAWLHFASLCVFWQPLAMDGTIDFTTAQSFDSFVDPANGQEVKGSLEGLAKSQAQALDSEHPEVVFRYSALVHEVRHLHDLLFTSWGTIAFLYHFQVVIEHLRLLEGLRRQGVKRIRIPLEGDGGALAPLLERARQATLTRDRWQEGGEPILEALAYLTQLNYAWQAMGEVAAAKVREQMPAPHGAVVEALDAMGGDWSLESPEWTPVVYQLLTGCLGAAGPVASPVEWLTRVVGTINPSRLAWNTAGPILKELILPLFADAGDGHSVLSRSYFGYYLETLEEDELLDSATRRRLSELLTDFYEQANRLQSHAREDPSLYHSLEGYLQKMLGPHKEAVLPVPRSYMVYPTNFSEARWGQPDSKQQQEEFWHFRVYQPPPKRVRRRLSPPLPDYEGPATELYLRPFPLLFGGRPVDPAWGRFARDFAGSVMLTEGYRMSNPIHFYWKTEALPALGFEVQEDW